MNVTAAPDHRTDPLDRPPAIEAKGLVTTFGRGAKQVRALDGLDLVAPAGQVTAVLGPNGAGKTTFVRAVATLSQPDAGELRVGGVDTRTEGRRVRRSIGLAGQFAAVDDALTGRENLYMVARMFGHDRRGAQRAADAVLDQLGLGDASRRPVRSYSGGMRRRLDLGSSLVGAPRLLVLDEPTTGLDPRSRIELWDTIRSLVAGGTELLLTTQYLEEADQLADHVVIVDRGRAIAAGTPSELKRRAGRDRVEVRVSDVADLATVADVLAGFGGDEPVVDQPNRRVTAGVDDGTARLSDALQELARKAIAIDDVGVRRPTLDEVFLTLTGRPADTTTDASSDPTDDTTVVAA